MFVQIFSSAINFRSSVLAWFRKTKQNAKPHGADYTHKCSKILSVPGFSSEGAHVAEFHNTMFLHKTCLTNSLWFDVEDFSVGFMTLMISLNAQKLLSFFVMITLRNTWIRIIFRITWKIWRHYKSKYTLGLRSENIIIHNILINLNSILI